MADPKDIHVDLLEIDMTTGLHWLHPLEKSGDDTLGQIRKRNRDKWLAEQQAKRDAKRSKGDKQRQKEYDESQHPRDDHGRWTDAGGGDGDGTSSESGRSPEQEAAHVRLVLHTGRAVAKELGYDASKVSIGAQESPDAKFVLNGREYKAAGLAYTTGPAKGMIKLFPKQISEYEMTKGITAHEVEHQKFQSAMDKFKEEKERARAEPGPPPDPNGKYWWQRAGGQDAVFTPDDSLRSPYDEKYPVYVSMHEAFGKRSFDDFMKSDGVSDYSYEYWKQFKNEVTNAHYRSAMHETLAEMGRIKYETGKFPDHMGERIISWRGEDKPKPSQKEMDANAKLWRDLYRTVEKVYRGEA
jgi:hypothetical protein